MWRSGNPGLRWAFVALVTGCAARGPAPETPEQTSERLSIEVGRAVALIQEHYVDEMDTNALVEGALHGALAGLDPHSAYLNESEYAIFRGDTEGRYSGIGVEVDYRSETLTIAGVMEGSPAMTAGLKVGDVLVAADGTLLSGMKLDSIIERMRGIRGTSITLSVLRKGVERPFQVTIVRGPIQVDSVKHTVLPGGVGYLRLRQFQDGSEMDLRSAAKDLEAHGATCLVLDLRSNPGGLIAEATAIADDFLERGVIFSMRKRGHVVQVTEASAGGALTDVPTVVLVNGYTASAAELLAAALQDAGRADIVGTKTFGKGSVQTLYELGTGSAIRVTTARYYTPSGAPIQARGVTPDLLIETEQDFHVAEGSYPGHLEAEVASVREPSERVAAPKDFDDADVASPMTVQTADQDFVLQQGIGLLRQRMAERGNAVSASAEQSGR